VNRPKITELPDGSWAIDYGPPGPFITLPAARMRGLVEALAAADWIKVNGQALRPRS
jgi:hypothetical protein